MSIKVSKPRFIKEKEDVNAKDSKTYSVRISKELDEQFTKMQSEIVALGYTISIADILRDAVVDAVKKGNAFVDSVNKQSETPTRQQSAFAAAKTAKGNKENNKGEAL